MRCHRVCQLSILNLKHSLQSRQLYSVRADSNPRIMAIGSNGGDVGRASQSPQTTPSSYELFLPFGIVRQLLFAADKQKEQCKELERPFHGIVFNLMPNAIRLKLEP